jgi:hypothetical protein
MEGGRAPLPNQRLRGGALRQLGLEVHRWDRCTISTTQEKPPKGGSLATPKCRAGWNSHCEGGSGFVPAEAVEAPVRAEIHGPAFEDWNVAGQAERIASLETDRKWHWCALTVVAVCGLGWLSWVSLALVSIKGDMQAVKQRIRDGGLGEIVSQLRSPESQDQLRANLSTVVAQIETAKVRGRKADPGKIKALSGAVAQVTRSDPEMQETWQAAAQLINFRVPSTSIPSTPCFRGPRPADTSPSSPPNSALTVYDITIAVKDCTFNLDDTEDVVKQDEAQISKAASSLSPVVSFRIVFRFQHVHLIYRGGTLPPIVNLYVFRDCTFDWQLPTVPTASGQKITQQLLEAENPSYVIVSAS